jgi:hypothetical protein
MGAIPPPLLGEVFVAKFALKIRKLNTYLKKKICLRRIWGAAAPQTPCKYP